MSDESYGEDEFEDYSDEFDEEGEEEAANTPPAAAPPAPSTAEVCRDALAPQCRYAGPGGAHTRKFPYRCPFTGGNLPSCAVGPLPPARVGLT